MKKIISILDDVLNILSDYFDKAYDLIDHPFDPYGSIAFEKRFSYQDRHKISIAVDELQKNPSIKSYTLSLEKETITIRIN